jgi:hypothetical protein
MKKIIAVLFAFCLLLTNCGEDNDDNVTITTPEASVGFRLSHNFDEMSVTNSNYTTLNLTNANGEILTIERLRYQISKVELINSEGVIYKMNDYHLLDLSNPETFSFDGDTQIPFGNYTLNFIWGFNEEDNIDGAYPDLNSASWNWPVMLGGGYHFLQFDGKYNVNTASPSPFNFHNGTARISPDNFEQNFVSFNFSQTIEINSDTNIELNMDISELFKNPNTWDLNVLDTSLMPNYNAQKMMQANIETVFTIGDIITN